MSIGKWADAAGHPPGSALVAAGFTGIFCYVGTPGRAKNLTADRYRDYVAHGLDVAGIFENDITDVTSGAGTAYARAAMADLTNCGAPRSTPLACAADRHLTPGEISTAVQYQRDFYNAVKRAGWVGPVGAYGFAEHTRAVHDAGVAEWLWQAGSPALLWPGVDFWQRNDGTAVVGGVEVDINEQYQPIPGGAPRAGASVSTVEDDEMPLLVPAGVDDHVNLIVKGKTELRIACSWNRHVQVHHLYFYGDTGADPNGTGVGGQLDALTINPNRPGPLAIPPGATVATLRYSADHAFTVGVA